MPCHAAVDQKEPRCYVCSVLNDELSEGRVFPPLTLTMPSTSRPCFAIHQSDQLN